MLPDRSKVVKHPTSRDMTKYWICPMCGFFNKNKAEVLIHIGDFHSYAEAETFGYEFIYTMYAYERTKKTV